MTSPAAPASTPGRPRRLGALATAFIAVVGVDQTVKIATAHAPRSAWLYPLRNHGLSLDVVTTTRWAETAAMAVGLVVVAIFLIRAVRREQVTAWPVALLLGGATSNLLDRARLGSVRDMFPIAHFIVINPADVAVLAGVLLLGATAIRKVRDLSEIRCKRRLPF